MSSAGDRQLCLWLEDVGIDDTDRVGGKNASLGEMLRNLESLGVAVPAGFATIADAYWMFIEENDLRDRIADELGELDPSAGNGRVGKAGETVRRMIIDGELPKELAAALEEQYRELGRRTGRPDVDVAVRSSATAEDLPEASFAGQQDTFSTWSASTGCSTPAGAASPLCSRTGRSSIAPSRVSVTWTSLSPSVSR